MAQKVKIWQICPSCKGEGVVYEIAVHGEPLQPVECIQCKGEKKVLWGEMEDLADKVNDCLDKLNDIMEKLNE